MAVITVSRQFGSGGDEISETICRTTGYHLFDKNILAKAAFESGLTDQEIVDYCEDNYRVKNFFDRLFGTPRPVGTVHVWKETTEGVRISEELKLNEEQSLNCVRKAIDTAHRLGNIVIVGRGGQVLLQDEPDVIHVRVIAPLEERIIRVRNSPQMANRTFNDSVEARRAAQLLIEKNDDASADYLHRFYGVDWSSPQLYHLIINTGKLSIDKAANVIIEAARLLQ